MADRQEKPRLELGPQTQVMGWQMRPDEVLAYFNQQPKKVLSFFGYSGAGYEHEGVMLWTAARVLERFSPETTLVNIGATRSGIGRVYPLAKDLGFETAGIVSTQSLDFPHGFSKFVDRIFFVRDQQWGGYLAESTDLSPTSEAIVSVSSFCIGIGGNEVTRDELLEAKRRGLPALFFPADYRHDGGETRRDPQEGYHGAAHAALRGSESGQGR